MPEYQTRAYSVHHPPGHFVANVEMSLCLSCGSLVGDTKLHDTKCVTITPDDKLCTCGHSHVGARQPAPIALYCPDPSCRCRQYEELREACYGCADNGNGHTDACMDESFPVCPEPSCPLYGRAVMSDHRHVTGEKHD